MDKQEEYAMDFTFLKIIGFYQLIDQNGLKIFNLKLCNVINILLIVFTTTTTVIGLVGFVYKTDESMENSFKNMQTIFYIACITVANLKMITIMRNADKLWDFFNIAHKSFLSNEYCIKNYYKIVDCGKYIKRTSPVYFLVFCITGLSWIIIPTISNNNVLSDETQKNQNFHKANVVNMNYPIAAKTYYTYYNVFYLFETIMFSYAVYGLVVFDIFLISILQILCVQYEIITSAYENLRFKADDEDGE